MKYITMYIARHAFPVLGESIYFQVEQHQRRQTSNDFQCTAQSVKPDAAR